jgi:hypothetical protein
LSVHKNRQFCDSDIFSKTLNQQLSDFEKKQFKNLNTKPAVINKKSNTHPTLVLTFLWAPTIILTSMFFHVKVYLLTPQKHAGKTRRRRRSNNGFHPYKL